MDEKKRIRVLMAKVGLDGHDRGLKIVSVLLRNEGFEVINLGCYQTADTVVTAAEQEDVDVIGLSVLGDEHRIHVPKIIKLLKERSLNNIVFVVGGVIPPEEIPELKKMGVDEVFLSGTLLSTIKEGIKRLVEERRQ